MQPVLVNRGQLVEQNLVKVFDNLFVALHGGFSQEIGGD
jgi:hypothetical protein